jgi:hypothetical protein
MINHSNKHKVAGVHTNIFYNQFTLHKSLNSIFFNSLATGQRLLYPNDKPSIIFLSINPSNP